MSGRLVAETSTASRAAPQYSARARLSGPVLPAGCFDDGVVSADAQLLGQDPRLRVVQVVQLLGQDHDPEPGEPGRLEGERVHGQLSGGQFGCGPGVQAP